MPVYSKRLYFFLHYDQRPFLAERENAHQYGRLVSGKNRHSPGPEEEDRL
jgi:hypothetical protein